ncbi:hypothetical protein Tco_1529334, partial [Tanacetum coccineum]
MVALLLCYYIKVMDPNSSIGKTCLGENVIELSSEKAKGHGDRSSPEYQDTANSGEAYNGEINLGKEKNMISNEFAVKLCLDHEFIINPEEDDVEPRVVLGRSFMRLTKGINDFGNGISTIYLKLDPFLDSSRETEKTDDDWDLLLDDLDFGDVPKIEGVEILPFVTTLSTGKLLTQEEAAKEELAIDICKRYSIQKEERP